MAREASTLSLVTCHVGSSRRGIDPVGETSDEEVSSNLVLHVIPEYATQMVVCSMALVMLDPVSVLLVIGIVTAIFISVIAMRGKDGSHQPLPTVPVVRDCLFVRRLTMRCTTSIPTAT